MSQQVVDAALLKLATVSDNSGIKAINEELVKSGQMLKKTGETGEMAFAKADKQAKSFTSTINKSYLAITAAVIGFKQMLDKQYAQAKSEAQLELSIKKNTTAISRQGQSVRGLLNDWKEFANAQEAATGIGDEATLALLNVLTTLQIAPSQVKRVAGALQDMEAVTGQSAEAMAKSMARLSANPEEALGALSRAGVIVRKEMLEGMTSAQQFDFILGEIENAFKDQAKTLYEAAGGYGKFKTEADNLTENLGKVLYPALSQILGLVGSLFAQFGKLSEGAQGVVVAIGGLAAALWGIAASNPIGWITGAIFAIGGLMAAADGFGNKAHLINKFNDSIEKANKGLAEISQQQIIQDDTLKRLSILQQGTAAYEQTVRELIKSNAELAKSGIHVKSSYKDIMDALKKLDTASGIAKMNRLKDIADEALATYYRAEAELPQLVQDDSGQLHYANPEVANALHDTMDSALVTMARSLAMQGRFTFHTPNTAGTILLNDGFAEFRSELSRLMTGSSTPSTFWSQQFNEQRLRPIFEQARALQPTGRQQIDTNLSQSTVVGPGAQQILYDLEALRIRLLEEFAARRRQIEKDYNEEKITVERATNLSAEQRVEALALLEQDKKKKLEQLEMERLAREKQARIDAINAAGEAAQTVMSIGTNIIRKDWKSAVGEALSMVPGVGQTLSGVFGAAVDFFGEIFGSTSKTEAERLGEWLEAAVQKFDLSFKRSETYSKLFGDLDLETINAEIASTTESLNKNLEKLGLGVATSRTELKDFYDLIKNDDFNFGGFLGHLKTITNQYGLATYNPGASGETGDPIDPRSEEEIAAFNADQIRKREEATRQYVFEYFKQVYGDNAETMMRYLGVIDEAGNLKSNKIINDIMGRFSENRQALLDIAEQTATWYKQLEDSQIKKGLAKTNDELDRINKKFEIGEITKEEMVKRSSEEIDNAIRYLETLEPTQKVLDAITDLTIQRIRLQKELNEESAVGLDIEDEKLKALLAQREALERDIAAGYVREGTASTVTQQEDILRQIIARAKELGLSRDYYFQYEEALAQLIEGYFGTSYTGMTGFGFAPGMSDTDYLAQFGVKPLDPSQVIPRVPITATQYYRESLQARSAIDSERAPRSNSAQITNNELVINAQRMPVDEQTLKEIDALLRRRNGRGFLNG